ncbi:cell wall surface anchor family protein [Streptococcus pneumoniae]|nr:cell wall surface anchor family protein [Streptococcus pneumoniae]
MKFNPNQRYTRWSIRRLSVGVPQLLWLVASLS